MTTNEKVGNACKQAMGKRSAAALMYHANLVVDHGRNCWFGHALKELRVSSIQLNGST